MFKCYYAFKEAKKEKKKKKNNNNNNKILLPFKFLMKVTKSHFNISIINPFAINKTYV